jgi:beta-phosphoglucomutase-like phosphatase (HAD superfamily)
VSGEDVPHGKPAPDIFLRTAALLGVPPSACLVIEDSANGVRAAIAAGMHCIALRNPNSGEQDLSAADQIVDSLVEIRFY